MTPVLSYDRRVSVQAPAEALYDYLADFTTTNEWDPRAVDTVRVDGDGEVGTRYECDVKFLGRRTHMAYTITRLEPGRRIEWTGENSFVTAHDTIELSEEPTGVTTVAYTSAYDYPRVPRPLARLFDLPLRRLCDEARDGLHETLRRRFAADAA